MAEFTEGNEFIGGGDSTRRGGQMWLGDARSAAGESLVGLTAPVPRFLSLFVPELSCGTQTQGGYRHGPPC